VRIVELPALWIIILDIVAWFVIHVLVSFIASRMPDHLFLKDSLLTRIRNWENEGQIWEDIFRVKRWKNKLPDGAAIFKKGFRKKNLQARKSLYYRQFIIETRRAEFAHWIAIAPSIAFFLWNPFWIGWFMIFYALCINMPCIIAQRYNRPRLLRIAQSEQSTSAPLHNV
jgi:glycosyl-4,4'-diaponeurosporenoate acyltransferase